MKLRKDNGRERADGGCMKIRDRIGRIVGVLSHKGRMTHGVVISGFCFC